MSGPDGKVNDPYDVSKNPSLVDLLRALERKIKLEIRTSVPATVVSFNPAPIPGPVPPGTGGNATVTVLVSTLTVNRLANPLMVSKTALLVNPARGEVTNAPVQLVNIPVEFPGGQSGGMTWNILPGDTGRLIVSDRCMSRWLADGAPHDPVVATTHGLADSVFVPGLRSLTTALGVVDPSATIIDGPLVKGGAGALDFVALAAKVLTELTALQTTINTHTHVVSGVTTGMGSVTSAPGLPQAAAPASVAATKLMGE